MDILNIGKMVRGVIDGGTGLVKTVFGSKQARDQQGHDRKTLKENNTHEKFLSGQNAFMAEFHHREGRTWWDSLWDGFNRMPRPVIVVTVFSYFIMAYKSPEEFQILNMALDSVPERMWWVMSAIIGFYFVAREFKQNRDSKLAMTDKEFFAQQTRIKKIRESKIPVPVGIGFDPAEPDREKTNQTVISVRPVNPSVEAWKRVTGKI